METSLHNRSLSPNFGRLMSPSSSSSSPPPSYYCPCLNVQLRRVSTVDSNSSSSLPSARDSASINSPSSDPFFKDAILLPENRFTISQRLECLCFKRPSLGNDRMLIVSCLNCRVDTHAYLKPSSSLSSSSTTSDDRRDGHPSTIFVSRQMNTDSLKVASLMQSDDYSRVYGILVRPFMVNEGNSMAAFGVLDQYAAHNRCEELKRSASVFLGSERDATTERIREHKKEQLTNLKQLESRVHQDRNILMQRIASAIQDDVGKTPNTFFHETAAAAAIPLPLKGVIPSDNGLQSNKAPAQGNKSFDVFAMDEDDVFTPYEEEEDGSISDEDECPSDDAPPPSSFTTVSDVRLFATSLPVSMPTAAWKRPSNASNVRRFVEDAEFCSPSSEKDDLKTDDPEWMAASIKALAMSVRGDDSTDLFGARPRPRLNTLD